MLSILKLKMSKKNKNGMDVQGKMYAKETGIQRFFIYSAV